MKFRVQHADKIVGLLIIIALISLVFVIIMIGRTQRWFSKNYLFVTYAASASGLTRNMAVNCLGFPIGNVKSFRLTEDNRVEVYFTLHDKYRDRAREGSIVEISVNPIGFGSQFIFHPGLGMELEEKTFIPVRDSPEARDYINRGLANIPPSEDVIASLVLRAGSILDEVQTILESINVQTDGDTATALGQTMVNIQQLTGNLSADLYEREIMNSLESSLVSLAKTMDHIEKSVSYVPREMPQIIYLLAEARTAIQAANDILISLKNNPFLRKGIPDHAATDSTDYNPRNIRF